MRHLSIFVILVLVGLAWWLLGDRARGPQSTPTVTDTKPTTETELVDAGSAAVERDTTTARMEVTQPAGPAQDTLELNTTIVLGRCVDTNGTPLADVTAELKGGCADERLGVYLRDHPPIEWSNPDPITTSVDGRFEFRFKPPPPYEFVLTLTPRDRMAMHGHWYQLQPARIVDLGDIVFGGDVSVRGRIVDTKGMPQEKVMISIHREDNPGPEGMRTHFGTQARSAADGSFTFNHALTPGTWSLSVSGASLVTPESRQVELTVPENVLDIVVEAPVTMATIEGIVVDQIGAPVRGAMVRVLQGGIMDINHGTGTNGRFMIRRSASEVGPDKLALSVLSDAHEPLQTEAVHAFGEEDVRLVLKSGLPLEIIVRREDDGTPVDDYSVWLIPRGTNQDRLTSADYRYRGGHRHENGIVRLTGIRRRPYLLSIEPAAPTGLFGVYFIELNVVDGGPSVIHVRLESLIIQRILVERSDGSPVKGSEVELLLAPPGAQVRVDSFALNYETGFHDDPRITLRVDVKTTGTDGSCALRGAPAPCFGIRVRGKGHVTTVLTNVRFGEVDPLRIIVPTGARLVGRLTPKEAVEDYRELVGLPRTGPLDETQGLMPSVQLQRMLEGAMESIPTGIYTDKVLLGFDGTFVIDGIPTGTWDLSITGTRGTASGRLNPNPVLHTGITFTDGETREETFDITSRRLGRLRAVVMLDGKTFEGNVQVKQDDGSEEFLVMCDAAGRFDVPVQPGRWTVSPLRKMKPQGSAPITPLEVATITAGESVEVTFRAHTAHAKVRVLSADGTPVGGVMMTVHDLTRGTHLLGTRTDADGRLDIWLAAGTYEVCSRWKQTAATQVRIGEVTLPAADEIVLRFP